MKCHRCGMETFRWMGRHWCFAIEEREQEDDFDLVVPMWQRHE